VFRNVLDSGGIFFDITVLLNIKKDSSGIRRFIPLPGVTASVWPVGLPSRQPPAIQTKDSFGIVGEFDLLKLSLISWNYLKPLLATSPYDVLTYGRLFSGEKNSLLKEF